MTTSSTGQPIDGPRSGLPQYRDARGRIRKIAGPAATSWPYPREVEIDGATFVEEPPWESGWGITYHYGPRIWRRQTPIGVFITQYAEGMASGFPWWPVVVFSVRAAVAETVRRVTRQGPPRP